MTGSRGDRRVRVDSLALVKAQKAGEPSEVYSRLGLPLPSRKGYVEILQRSLHTPVALDFLPDAADPADDR